MADNSLRTPGSGETIASDDVGGVKFQRVKLTAGPDGTAVDVLNPADAMVAANSGVLPTATQLFNETTFDRQRNNTVGSLFASAARTAFVQSATQTNYNARGVIIGLNITVASGTGGLQVVIGSVDPISGGTVGLNPSPTAVIATGLTLYVLYPAPGSGVFGGVAQFTSGVLPRSWNVTVLVGNATSYTYSVSYQLIV